MPTRTIGSGQRAALIEAAEALYEILPPAERPNVKVVGGTACLIHGGSRWTNDVDIAATNPATLHSILQAINDDTRFKNNDLEIEYTSPALDITVGIELLIGHGDSFSVLPPMGPGVTVAGVRAPVARLEDILLSKLVAFVDRGEDKDLEDASWGLRVLARRGESMRRVDESSLGEAVAQLKTDGDRDSELLLRLLAQVGVQV